MSDTTHANSDIERLLPFWKLSADVSLLASIQTVSEHALR